MNTSLGLLLEFKKAILIGDGSLWSAVATLVVSIAVPLLIIIGKRAVKQIRADSFRRLETSFGKPDEDDTEEDALLDPTFDSVKYKYVDKPEPAGDDETKGWSAVLQAGPRFFAWLMPVILYSFSVVVFAVIVAFFVDILFVSGWLTKDAKACGDAVSQCLSLSGRVLLLGFQEPGMSAVGASASALTYAHNSVVMLSFAFAGAYLWCILYLVRRVNNFDLTPYSFLLCGMRILLTLSIALTIRHAVFSNDQLPADTATPIVAEAPAALSNVAAPEAPSASSAVTTAASETPRFKGGTGPGWYVAIMTAFLLGFYPLAGLNYLVQRVPELALKRPHPDAGLMRYALPLDMIDGLTAYVQFRLEELEYDDVQNMATANPVLLYVETPYNILEIIDWIAQAQLITAVGPKKVSELRKINVRTIFDLARIGDSDRYRRAALDILVDSAAFRQSLATAGNDEIQATFNCMFTSIADDLHVVRLARVWNAFYKVYQRGEMPDIATRGLLKKPNVVQRLLVPSTDQTEPFAQPTQSAPAAEPAGEPPAKPAIPEPKAA
ncbi:MAG TPA: hypothetical protein VGQ35_00960 [Dongiaceae bacterium]|jgi:hypothetical protein|nr:hypothetical protein [Dongiaceae bacterium]